MSVHKLDDLAFVSVNDAVEAVGVKKEYVLSINLFDFVREEDQAALRTAVENLKAWLTTRHPLGFLPYSRFCQPLFLFVQSCSHAPFAIKRA